MNAQNPETTKEATSPVSTTVPVPTIADLSESSPPREEDVAPADETVAEQVAAPSDDAVEESTSDLPPEHDGQLDDIEIQVAHREWRVSGEIQVRKRDGSVETQEWARTYVQKPLSFAAMMQFTGLIGQKLSEAMSGPDGMSLDGVLAEADGIAGAGRALLTQQDFAGVDSFIRGLAKLASYVPDVVEECQCIWLRIPFHERAIVKEIWSRSPEDGGLTTAEGEEMMEVFLAQNYEEVEDFFSGRLTRLVTLVRALRKRKAKTRSQSDG